MTFFDNHHSPIKAHLFVNNCYVGYLIRKCHLGCRIDFESLDSPMLRRQVWANENITPEPIPPIKRLTEPIAAEKPKEVYLSVIGLRKS